MLIKTRLVLVEYISISELLYVGLRKLRLSMYYFLKSWPNLWCCLIPTDVNSPHNGFVSFPSPKSFTWYRAPCLVKLTTWKSFALMTNSMVAITVKTFIRFINKKNIFEKSCRKPIFLHLKFDGRNHIMVFLTLCLIHLYLYSFRRSKFSSGPKRRLKVLR